MRLEIRDLIREVLAEELAAFRAECRGESTVREERVALPSSAALTDFVQNLLRRAEDADFVAAVRAGRLRFVLDGVCAPALPAASKMPSPPTAPAPAPAPLPELSKPLITERDIAALPEGQSRLRIGRNSRLTPLAGDESRRRGIRIERKTA